MSSKNNPEMRGAITELRKYNGKTVKPVRVVSPEMNINFIGAAYENGDLVLSPQTKRPIPYQDIQG